MKSYFHGVAQSSIAVAGSTRFANLDGVAAGSATETQVQQVMPGAAAETRDLDQFHVQVATAPGAAASGKTIRFRVRKNGVDTALDITLTETQTSGSYTGAAVTFTAGDKVSVAILLASGGTVPGSISWSVRQTGTGQAVMFGSSTAITATTFYPATTGAPTTEANVLAPCPVAGNITSIYVMSDVNPTPGNWQVAARIAGSDSTATVNLPAGTAANTPVATTGVTAAVTVGQTLSIHVTAAASPASSRLWGGFVIVPTTDGEAVMLGSCATAVGNGATNYLVPHGNRNGTPSTTEGLALPQQLMQVCTIKALYAVLSGTAGASKSYDITVRLNNATDTAATVNIAGGSATTGNITGLGVAVAANDLLDIKDVPNSTPTARLISTGIRYTLAGEVTVAPAGPAGAATVSVTRVARNRQLWNTVGP